jgi:hypothetical protein
MMRALYHFKRAEELAADGEVLPTAEQSAMRKGHALERNILGNLGESAVFGHALGRLAPMPPGISAANASKTRGITGAALGALMATGGTGYHILRKHLDPGYGKDVPGVEHTDYSPFVPAALQFGMPAAALAATTPLADKLVGKMNIKNRWLRGGARVSGILPGAVAGKLLADYLERKYQEES